MWLPKGLPDLLLRLKEFFSKESFEFELLVTLNFEKDFDRVSNRVEISEDEELIEVEIHDILSENNGYSLPKHHRCSSHMLNLIASKDIEKSSFFKQYQIIYKKCLDIFPYI